MRSDYKRIAITMLGKYGKLPNVQFAADVWEARNWAGWGVRVTWDAPEHGLTDVTGIMMHCENEAEAQAIVDAIERWKELRKP